MQIKSICQGEVAMKLFNKKRRKRRQTDFEEYKRTSMAKIENLNNAIAKSNNADEIKKLKNKVSAYESRLLRRIAMENQRELLDESALQWSKIKEVLQEELQATDFERVTKRVERDIF